MSGRQNELRKASANLLNNELKICEQELKALKQLPKSASSRMKKASLLEKAAFIYFEFGSFAEALKLYQDSLRTYEHVLDEHNPKIADMNNSIGLVYQELEDEGEKALEHFERSLKLRKEMMADTFDQNYFDSLAETYNYLGAAHRNLGAYQTALDMYLEALRIYRRPDEPNLGLISEAMSNIGLTDIFFTDENQSYCL
jgi:tetratricopeptide (TPR) repeat protein